MTRHAIDLPNGRECGCDAHDTAPGLITIDQALAGIDALVTAISETETVAIARARGRVLAAPVTATFPAPRFDNSAMDGFAIRLADLSGEGPWHLPVAGCQRAGATGFKTLPAGAAVQIFTGAVLPDGADAVIMQEHVAIDAAGISIRSRPDAGENIRRAGEDMRPGDVVTPKGRRIGPRDIAAIAAAGHGSVPVRRRVRVGILTTGDELRHAGEQLATAQIFDVNTPMLTSLIEAVGAEVIRTRYRSDTREGIRRALQDLSTLADLIVTSGGISVGAADHVKPALLDAGGEIALSGVAIKPGKPVSAGRLGKAIWLGLPGNPVSAFVTWSLFGQRILDRLTAHDTPETGRRHAVTANPLHHRPGRCELRLATLIGTDAQGREIVDFPAQTHSNRVSQLADADGLIFIPAETDHIPEGGMVEFQPFLRH